MFLLFTKLKEEEGGGGLFQEEHLFDVMTQLVGTYLEGVWCFLWGGCLFAQLLVELGQCVKIGSCRFFQEKLKIKSGTLMGHLSTICPQLPTIWRGEGGNKQAYLLKFKCWGDVESLI